MTNVKEGDFLGGKYRVEKILGTGGMGIVVAARHAQLDERVAIKFLRPDVLNNSEAVSRFASEARAAVKIKSEHVARVIDVDVLDDGSPYMVMEYLDGSDLHCWMEEKGVLEPAQAVEFVLQACEAIAEAHVLGIVHRDLKPANLFCIRKPDGVLSIKVLDFGISKTLGSHIPGGSMGVTGTMAIMGSPLYMSPEQLRSSRDVDVRTDIWSLGAMLFELITGKTPFASEAFPELCVNIATQPTPLVRACRPEVPMELEQVICKCLEKDRSNRFSNVAELALALAPVAPKRSLASVQTIRSIIESAGLSACAMPSPVSTLMTSAARAETTNVTWGHTTPPKGRSNQWMLLGILGVGAALGIAVLLWLWPTQQHAPNAASSSVQDAAINSQPVVVATVTSPVAESTRLERSADAPISLSRESVDVAHVTSVTTSVPSAAKTKSRNGSRQGSPEVVATSSTPSHGAPPGKPHCDPNYTLDSEGRKHFKPECF